MAITKFTADSILDAALNEVKNTITEMYVCSGADNPATRAAAIAAALASKTGLTSASFTGPADGDTSGRKITKNSETEILITASGTSSCVALCTATELKHVCKIDSQVLTANGVNKINTPAFTVVEILDVTQD